jgi:hypothetical protein
VSYLWTETKLWLALTARSGAIVESAKHLLTDVMPHIQLVLEKGGTAALDFTLHDADHSYRVAERMFTLLPTSTLEALSAYEIVLLLLS